MAFSTPGNTLVKQFDYICQIDPALDTDTPGFEDLWRQYTEQGNADILPLRAGQQPTVWQLRHVIGKAQELLLGELHAAQEDDSKVMAAMYNCCRYAVVGARNFVDDKGVKFPFKTRKCGDTGATMLDDDTMAQLKATHPSLVYDLGSRAVRAMVISPLS